ncbi:MAG: hypothetical protein HYZ27_07785, partial [Deltaproteobacteria bacterium]|nr:hypothetical protein [Deltaproteobacteria bacterium]
GRISVRPSTSKIPKGRSLTRWLYALAGVLAGVAVVLGAFLTWRQVAQPVGGRPGAPAVGSLPSPLYRLEVAVKGGTGTLYVDGRHIGKAGRRSVKLEAGEHEIEVRGGQGKRLRRTVRVKEGHPQSVVVDLRRRTMSVD